MSNSYFNFTTGRMVAGENALAEDVNSGFDAVAAGFDKLPTPDATKFLAGAHETTSGSAGNFVLAVTADSYFDGMAVSFKANHSNSGACTLNVGSLGAKSLVDGSGAALAVGDIVANSIYAARYNSTSDKFHLVGLSSGNAADAAVVAANIADVATIADNIDELLLVDDNAIAAAASASDASGYADDALTQAGLASGYADAASASAANLPNATTAGADKLLTTNAAGDGWEYPLITAAGKALLDDADAAAQRATLGFQSDALTRSRKNLLINGGFEVWQRGTSFTGTNDVYTADRWRFFDCVTPARVTISRVAAHAVSGAISPYSLRIAVSGGLALGVLEQRLEDALLFSGKTITFTTLGHSLTADQMAVQVFFVPNLDTPATSVMSSAQAISLTASCAAHSVSFTLPTLDPADYVFGKSYIALQLVFNLDDGHSLELNASQLEFGDTATDFEYRHPAEELALCQRYYETGTLRGPFSQYLTTYAVGPYCQFLVQKRRIPNVITGALTAVGNDGTPGILFGTNEFTRGFNPVYNWTGGTAGRSFFGQLDWIADAEL